MSLWQKICSCVSCYYVLIFYLSYHNYPKQKSSVPKLLCIEKKAIIVILHSLNVLPSQQTKTAAPLKQGAALRYFVKP